MRFPSRKRFLLWLKKQPDSRLFDAGSNKD